TDLDTPTLAGATISISVGFQVGDLLAFVDTANITGSYNPATGVLTLTGTDTLAAWQTALRTITFETTHDDPPVTKTVSWTATDGEYTSIPATRNIAITPVNDAPVIDAQAAVLAYIENDVATVIAPATTIADPDSANFNGGSLTAAFTANGTAADQLAIRNEGTGAGQIGVSGANVSYGGAVIGTFAGGVNGADLVITFTTTAATQAAVQALSRNITFANTSEDPSTSARTVTFTVVDGDGVANGGDQDGTTTATVTVGATNDLAVVTTTAGTAAYIEGAAATIVDGTVTISVVDDANLVGATVSLSAGFQVGDELAFVNTANITGSYNPATGVLTLSGTDTVAAYQAALQSITFRTTTNDDPGTSRTVSWVVNDGVGDSAAATRGIALTPVNDAPVIDAQAAVLGYTENDAATVIAPATTVADPDSADFMGGSLTAAFTANGTSDDQLAIRNEGTGAGQIGVSGANVSYGGSVIATFAGGANGADLVITFTTAAATQAAVQALSRNITFANTSEDPAIGARTVTFTVVDGDGTWHGGDQDGATTATVNVTAADDAPVVTATAGTTAYIEGAAAVAIDATLTVADADDTNLESATASITAGFQVGDELAFVNTANITGSYNAATGVLTLSGTDTEAAYQAALQSITFRTTTNDDPGTSRTVSYVANDGTSDGPAATRNITITPVNDAPVIDAQAAVLGYTENDAATVIAAATTVADPDSVDFMGGSLTAAFTANGTAADQLAIRNEGTGAGQIGVSGANVSYGGFVIGTFAGGVNGADLVITFTTPAASQPAVQALARNITFANTSEDPSTLARTVTFTVVDGDGTANGGDQDGTTTATVNFTAVNDAPVVTPSGGDAAYTESGPAVVIDASITVTDVDSTTMSGATVQITDSYLNGFDTLAFTGTGATGNIAVGGFNAGTGTLTLTSAGGTATAAQWQAALRLVEFDSTSPGPGPSRQVTFQLDDGDGGSNLSTPQVKNIAITETNSAPVIDAQAAALGYTENDAATVIASATTVSDPDSTDFNGGSLTAAFTANGTAADQLAIRNEGNGAGQIGVSGANVSYGGVLIGTFAGGVNGAALVITFTSAAATPAAVQALSRNITFANTSEDPSTLARTVTFTVVDGDGVANGGDQDGATTATINVAAANDAPVLTPSGGNTAFTEAGAAVAIDGAITVADIDSTTMTNATVQVTGGYLNGFDTLAFTGTGATGNILGAFTAATGTLTLTSAGGTATMGEWQAALRLVTFDSTSTSPGATREISFQLDDGDGGANLSTVVTKNIAITEVNSRPVITMSAGTGDFIENAAAVQIDPGLTITDPDTTTLSGASVTIFTNFTNAEDQLVFVNTANITGVYNFGQLTLTGVDTLANYEAALRSVRYNNTSDTPNTATRTFAFQVDDGQGVFSLSQVVYRDVTVAATNDAPVLAGGGTLGYTENGAAAAISPAMTVADPDSANFDTGTLTVSLTANGTASDQLAISNDGVGAGQIGVSG
ncbi:beta strand repeat-containing protein, partial [Ramlibacter sp. WS9]|uniref:beta strand repeat-containing protein n=1 Tax=Ramlibacter sp. WS9 TaxID=1882741 RepID=UPI00116B0953